MKAIFFKRRRHFQGGDWGIEYQNTHAILYKTCTFDQEAKTQYFCFHPFNFHKIRHPISLRLAEPYPHKPWNEKYETQILDKRHRYSKSESKGWYKVYVHLLSFPIRIEGEGSSRLGSRKTRRRGVSRNLEYETCWWNFGEIRTIFWCKFLWNINNILVEFWWSIIIILVSKIRRITGHSP